MAAEQPDAETPVAAVIPPGNTDFGRFWQAEYPGVVRLTFALTGRRDVAEELAQDAFVAVFRRWEEVATLERPAAWVRQVATNAAISALRRRSAELRAVARIGQRRVRPVELPEQDRDLWAAVRALPRRQAQALALMAVEDRTAAEVATILGVSEDTVRTHARRGREALARRLGLEGGQ